jgi:hypothetical protein
MSVAVLSLVQLCVQAADQRHSLFEGLDSISGSIRRLAEYENLLWNDGNQRLEEVEDSMVAACSNILEFQIRAACYLQRNPIASAIRDTFKLDQWDELLVKVKKSELSVKGCAERQSWQKIRDIFGAVYELKCDISRQEVRQETASRKKDVDAFLQLLFKNGCNYTDSKNRNAERLPGTCNWFTNHHLFQQWSLPVEGGNPSLLYVTADPGCGKSVLSRYLIDNILPDDDRTVCYFFFKDDFEDQKSSLNALCTLLHQLFEENRHLLTDEILEKYGARGDSFVLSFSDMWSMFVAAAAYQEIVCVFDALDECTKVEMRDLIEAITKLSGGFGKTTGNQNLKFLCTSRPYGHIRREFVGRHDSHTPLIHLQGDSAAEADYIADEIKIVVKGRIQKTVDTFKLTPDEHKLIEEQMDTINNRTYLWITLVFDGFMDKEDGIGKRDILDLTTKLPESVYAAYEKILNKSRNLETAKRVLYMVLGAKRPLSLSEMSVALAFKDCAQSSDQVKEIMIPENRIQGLLRDVGGLFVSVVNKNVYLLHQTAREFLIQSESGICNKQTECLVNQIDCDSTSTTLVVRFLTV